MAHFRNFLKENCENRGVPLFPNGQPLSQPERLLSFGRPAPKTSKWLRN